LPGKRTDEYLAGITATTFFEGFFP
jgi:hypothetical protein